MIKLFSFLALLSCSQNIFGQDSIAYITGHPLNIIAASVTDMRTGKPAGGVRTYLSVPGSIFELRTALSDTMGKVRFLIQNLRPGSTMIFQTDQRRDSTFRFDAPDPFAGAKYASHNDTDSLAFFGRPDKRYMLDDYTRFPTLEEVLIEFVPEVKIKKVRGHYSLQVFNTPYKIFFEEEPMVLIDGVPVFNIDALMAIDPLKIKKLEVMARKYYYGTMGWNGIISFSTYEGDLAGYTLFENALVKENRK